MRILLDSHAFVWFLDGSSRLSHRARSAIEADEAIVFISAVTGWEIASKVRLGKWPEAVTLAASLTTIVTRFGFVTLPVTLEHALTAGLLPGDHRDPFDRMLAAQASVEGIPIVTADPALRGLGADVLW
jgi:PIN domain nuclease of toxin-antitoxin system